MTTYSTSLKLALIGDGQEVGTWGQTTNTNFGTLIEQAITGATSINMLDANVTLSSLNGTLDQARNQVLVLTGTNNAVRDVIPPVVKKTYIVVNNTAGGYAIRVIGASGTGVLVPNGTTSLIFCDGTSFIEAINSNTITGNSIISGNLAVGGATTLTGALTGNTAAFSGVVTAPTAANGTNTTQVATTAFVNSAVTSATGSLGTMSTQNANAVAITGGNVSNVTVTGGSINNVSSITTSGSVDAGGRVIGVSPGGGSSGGLTVKAAASSGVGYVQFLNNAGNSQLAHISANGSVVDVVSPSGLTVNSTPVPPRPSLTGLGSWVTIGASNWNGSGWVLPGGGTWAWFISNRGGGLTGIDAGGAVVAGSLGSPSGNFGFAWQITG